MGLGTGPPRTRAGAARSFTGSHVEEVNAIAWNEQRDFITRMGFEQLLEL
jgi:hypothetical protein